MGNLETQRPIRQSLTEVKDRTAAAFLRGSALFYLGQKKNLLTPTYDTNDELPLGQTTENLAKKGLGISSLPLNITHTIEKQSDGMITDTYTTTTRKAGSPDGILLEVTGTIHQKNGQVYERTYEIISHHPTQLKTTTVVDSYPPDEKIKTTLHIEKEENPNYQYASLIAQALDEAKDPLVDLRHPSRGRLFSKTKGWGSKLVATIGDIDIKLGYQEPFFNNDTFGLMVTPPPIWGLFFDDGIYPYIKAKSIGKKLDNHIKDATAPILFAIAQEQNKLSPGTIQRAQELEAVTVINNVIYIPHGPSGKMIEFHPFNAREPITQDTVDDALKMLDGMQETLKSFDYQAIIIEKAEEGDTWTFSTVGKTSDGPQKISLLSQPISE